jgi:hypothetical protein
MGIPDYHMAFLEMFYQGVKIIEMQATTCVIPAHFFFPSDNIERVYQRSSIALYA